MYMQSLTQLPFDKFQYLTLGASKNIGVVQKYTFVFDYQEVTVERSKGIPKLLRPRCSFINITMRAQPLNISSSFVGIKYSSKAVDCISTIYSCFQPCSSEEVARNLSWQWFSMRPSHPKYQFRNTGWTGNGIQRPEWDCRSVKEGSVAVLIVFWKKRTWCIKKERDSPHPSNKGTHDNSENACSNPLDTLIFGVSSFGMWKVAFSIKLACLTAPKSFGLSSPRLFWFDTSTLKWSWMCAHCQCHSRAERKWWKKDLQIDCSTPRQSHLPTPKEPSSLLRVRRTPFNTLHP